MLMLDFHFALDLAVLRIRALRVIVDAVARLNLQWFLIVRLLRNGGCTEPDCQVTATVGSLLYRYGFVIFWQMKKASQSINTYPHDPIAHNYPSFLIRIVPYSPPTFDMPGNAVALWHFGCRDKHHPVLSIGNVPARQVQRLCFNHAIDHVHNGHCLCKCWLLAIHMDHKLNLFAWSLKLIPIRFDMLAKGRIRECLIKRCRIERA